MAKVFKSDTWVNLTATVTREVEYSGTAGDLAEALGVSLAELSSALRDYQLPDRASLAGLEHIADMQDEGVEIESVDDEDDVTGDN